MAKNIEGDDGKKIASGGSEINTPKTIWTNVRDNGLATPDAYSEEGNPSFISEFGASASKGLAELGNMFKGGGGASAKLQQAMSFMSGVSNALGGSGSITDKLINLSKQAPSTLASLGIDKSSQILSTIDKAANVVVKMNDAYEKIRNTDFSNVASLATLAKDLTGVDFLSLSNHFTQAEYSIGLIKQMMDADIPNSFGIFKDLLKDNPLKNQVVRDTYPSAIKNQDLKSIQSMVKLIGDRQFRNVTGQTNLSGNFINTLSKNWNKDKERLDTNLHKQYKEIKDTIKETNGKDWIYVKRNKEETINIKDFLYSTDRFKEIVTKAAISANKIKISEDSETNKEILQDIAGNENTRIDDEKFLIALNLGSYLTPRESIKKHFPKVHIEPNLVYIN